MATYAIGDIQGCHDELLLLLKSINFNRDTDNLWFTGDLVNRGRQSLQVLRFVKSLGGTATVVLGNHDLHLLAIDATGSEPGQHDTLDEILIAEDKTELLEWLRSRSLIHVDTALNFSMVHAGLHPDWNMGNAVTYAREVENVLRGPNYADFFANMYGNKPATWKEDLSGWSRLRHIINVLTRMRFITTNSELALNEKGPPGSQSENALPWYEARNRACIDQRVIFGHWSTLSLTKDIDFGKHNVFPLDTGCLWGGRLTALKIDGDTPEWHHIPCKAAQTPNC